MEKLFAYARWKEIIAVVFLIIIGLTVRLEDIRDWQAHPERAMYKGEPLLTTFDGYFYLSLAKDLLEGTYTKIDYNRDVPRGVKRRFPPPLISTIGAFVSKVTGYSLNWIGAVLPAFLGILLIIPVYGLGLFYGGRLMAFSACLFSLLSFYYVYRSSLGWFDTDCMNVTWTMAAFYCFLMFGVKDNHWRYGYFALGLLVYVMFLLWWDSTPAVTTVICAIPLFISVLFFYRPVEKKELFIFLIVNFMLLFCVLLWQGFDLPIRIIKQVIGTYHYITTKTVQGIWPSIGATISEQSIPSFMEIVQKTIGSEPGFILAVFGLVLLIAKRPKESLFLTVPIILAGLSFFTAKRFLIFFAPVIALGLGYLVHFSWELRRKNGYIILLPLLILVLLGVPMFQKCMAKTFWPKEPPHLIDGMVFANKNTPKDSVIWAWWDHGYPLRYFARRGTVGDGTIHGGERSSYNGIPLATNNERLAANFMCFYVARGWEGIHEFYRALNNDVAKGQRLMLQILASGPDKGKEILEKENLDSEKWLRFFYPEKHRPVFLFLDWRLTVTSYWWYWLGSWNVEKRQGIHPVYQALYGIKLKGKKIIGYGFQVDIEKGFLLLNGKKILLKRLVVYGKDGFRRQYERENGLNFEAILPLKFGAVMDNNISESVFNKLFLRHRYNPRYFSIIRGQTPSHQIWRVMGDKL